MRLAILGTRGIPARYGGFETLAEELSARLAGTHHGVPDVGFRTFKKRQGAQHDVDASVIRQPRYRQHPATRFEPVPLAHTCGSRSRPEKRGVGAERYHSDPVAPRLEL